MDIATEVTTETLIPAPGDLVMVGYVDCDDRRLTGICKATEPLDLCAHDGFSIELIPGGTVLRVVTADQLAYLSSRLSRAIANDREHADFRTPGSDLTHSKAEILQMLGQPMLPESLPCSKWLVDAAFRLWSLSKPRPSWLALADWLFGLQLAV